MKLFNKTLNNSCEHKNFDKKIFFSFSLLLRGKILTHQNLFTHLTKQWHQSYYYTIVSLLTKKLNKNLKPLFSQELHIKVFNTVLNAFLFELKIIITEH